MTAPRARSSLRRFQPTDLHPIKRLILDTIDLSYARDYPPRAVAFFKTFHAEQEILARSQAGSVLVIAEHDGEENGELIGTGSLVQGEILAVFVHPRHQRGGHGKALMHALENEARASGATEVRLSVSLPSRRFYQSLGYRLVEACSRDVGDGQRLDFWKAEKRLTPLKP
ncbi:MAG: GNAT family N-acetyltransferase [Geminicoccaceae bacterium]